MSSTGTCTDQEDQEIQETIDRLFSRTDQRRNIYAEYLSTFKTSKRSISSGADAFYALTNIRFAQPIVETPQLKHPVAIRGMRAFRYLIDRGISVCYSAHKDRKSVV